MNDRYKVLGVSVDLYSTQMALNKTYEFVADKCFRIVYLADSKLCLLSEKNDDIARILDNTDMVLPGDVTLRDGIKAEIEQYNSEVFAEEYINSVLYKIEDKDGYLYLIAKTREQFERYEEYIRRIWPYMAIGGVAVEDSIDDNLLWLANDINAVAPDLLITCADHNWQLEFIDKLKSLVNVELCICTGDLFEDITKVPIKVPEGIKKFKLEKLYMWLIKHKTIHTTIMDSIFKKRVKKENSRRDEDDKEQQNSN